MFVEWPLESREIDFFCNDVFPGQRNHCFKFSAGSPEMKDLKKNSKINLRFLKKNSTSILLWGSYEQKNNGRQISTLKRKYLFYYST